MLYVTACKLNILLLCHHGRLCSKYNLHTSIRQLFIALYCGFYFAIYNFTSYSEVISVSKANEVNHVASTLQTPASTSLSHWAMNLAYITEPTGAPSAVAVILANLYFDHQDSSCSWGWFHHTGMKHCFAGVVVFQVGPLSVLHTGISVPGKRF